MSDNPNNCETCDHKHCRVSPRDDDLHCYMFKDAPAGVCMQHTSHKMVKTTLLDFARLIKRGNYGNGKTDDNSEQAE